ncbi:hypothetical protein AB1N83_007173 [Pleurotus pulmonarius]
MLQTPLKQNTNVHYHSTNTSALQTDEQKTHFRKQEKLRTIVKRELRNATFEASWVPDTFCPADPIVVTRVLELLKKKQVFSTTLGGDRVVLTDWPAPGAGERQFYAPFVDKLNAIIDAFQFLYPNQYARSFFCGTRFYVYDRSMLGSVDGEAALKPDLLASKSPLDGGLRIYWYHAMLGGEVKLSWPELVAQAATYARCIFAATEHRVFIPILCLNHAEGSFRLCLYHRGGLLASTAMNLKTIVGFHLFVSTIVGLWQWDSLKKASMTPSIVSPLFSAVDRLSVLGRPASLSSSWPNRLESRLIKAFKHDINSLILSSSNVPTNLMVVTRRRMSSTPCKAEHTAVEWDIISPDEDELDSDYGGGYGRTDAGEDNVAAYQVEGSENLIIKPVEYEYKTEDGSGNNDDRRGSGGYVDHNEDCDNTEDGNNDDNEDGGSEVDEDDGSNDDDAAIQEVKPHTIEIRRHRHLIIKTVGRHLELVDGPRTLARAIQHAIIGHCALFTVGGYLHRDVSNGNIVVLPKPIDGCKIPPILSSTVQSNQCIAVLIDGDVAKEWGSREQASHRSQKSGVAESKPLTDPARYLLFQHK